MMGGKKKKSKKKKFSVWSFIATVVFLVSIFVFGRIRAKLKEEKLKENGFNTIAIVEKLKPYSRKGKRSRKDIVYFYFVKNDTVFHKISDLNSGTINRLDIKINDAFDVRVVIGDYGMFKVDYEARVDTVIDKRDYQHQNYNTFIHRNIIE